MCNLQLFVPKQIVLLSKNLFFSEIEFGDKPTMKQNYHKIIAFAIVGKLAWQLSREGDKPR